MRDCRRIEEEIMRAALWVVVVAAGLVLATVPARAHHAFAAEFDAQAPVKLEGTITKIELINPHAWIHVNVKKSDGTEEEWMVEAGTPNALMRSGFNKDRVKVGMQVVVDGFQSKDRSNRANGRNILLPDGSKLFVGSANTGAPGETPPVK
jgi:hypothetical protein